MMSFAINYDQTVSNYTKLHYADLYHTQNAFSENLSIPQHLQEVQDATHTKYLYPI